MKLYMIYIDQYKFIVIDYKTFCTWRNYYTNLSKQDTSALKVINTIITVI